jgi:hypothetical protein
MYSVYLFNEDEYHSLVLLIKSNFETYEIAQKFVDEIYELNLADTMGGEFFASKKLEYMYDETERYKIYSVDSNNRREFSEYKELVLKYFPDHTF